MEQFLRRVGKCIARCRKEVGLSQIQAASRSKVSYRYYQKIESGKANITLQTLFRLAKTLEVTPCEILRRSNDEE